MSRSVFLILPLLLLTACGGGSGSEATAQAKPTPTPTPTPVTPATTVGAGLGSAAPADGVCENPPVPVSQLPAQVTIGGSDYAYCADASSDDDGDGWGWENNNSCVVRNGAADPDADPNAATPGIDPDCFDIATAPVNANATQSTRNVYSYLRSVFGKKTLSGQQDLTWNDAVDMYDRVLQDTGKAPAIMGFDFMNYGSHQAAGQEGQMQTQEALAHWARGGLVTFCWHWRDPGGASNAFYSDETAFRIPFKAGELDQQSTDFASLVDDMDRIADELKVLQNDGVVVLWRPLHESSGGWFWWGASRTDGEDPAQAQIALWRYMYDRFTRYHGLNNLLWVWNGQHANWYPGDDVVDIVGEDVYGEARNYRSNDDRFLKAYTLSSAHKLLALTENSNMPDPAAMARDSAVWLYFLTWNDASTNAGITDKNNFWTGQYYNTDAHKRDVYEHANIITLDQLPAF